jgi:hypothetical protein
MAVMALKPAAIFSLEWAVSLVTILGHAFCRSTVFVLSLRANKDRIAG